MTNNKYDEKIIEQEEMKLLSMYTYGKTILPERYKILNCFEDKRSDFQAYVVQRGNNIVISFRGTEWTHPIDLRNDIAMARSRIPAQTTEALKLYDKVAAEYPNAHIVLTGHSLGGSLAQIVGAIRDTGNFNLIATFFLKSAQNKV